VKLTKCVRSAIKWLYCQLMPYRKLSQLMV